jgi:uncharacterized protein
MVEQALFLEYEDVMGRNGLFRKSPLKPSERQEFFRQAFFEAFLSACHWVKVYYSWRPNLKDEGDNHVLELVVAAGAAIVTNNMTDFAGSDLRFPDVRVATPSQLLENLS